MPRPTSSHHALIQHVKQLSSTRLARGSPPFHRSFSSKPVCLQTPAVAGVHSELTISQTYQSGTFENSVSTTPILPSKPKSRPSFVVPTLRNTKHHDLASYSAHVQRTGTSTTSNVYRGTVYEYLAQATLRRYGFQLQRCGGRADQGVDLIGHWHIPESLGPPLRVLVQCKRSENGVGPSVVRELEGAFRGAPAGWRGSEAVGVLVGRGKATRGVLEALRKSERGLVWVLMEELEGSLKGRVKQVLWNPKAAEIALEGVNVVPKYSTAVGGLGPVPDHVVLVWKGKEFEPFLP